MAEDARERIIRYLNDAHAAEQGGINGLEALAASATDPDLKAAAAEHLGITRSQAQRLEQRITALGGTINPVKGVIDSIISLGSHFVNIFHDKEDKQTQDLIKATALEQFEVGAYLSLKAYASSVQDEETARLASEILAEEQQARQKMEGLIPQVALSALNKTV